MPRQTRRYKPITGRGIVGEPAPEKPFARRMNGTQRNRHYQRLLAKDPHCYYCRVPLTRKSATLDHIVSRWAGGTNAKSNLVLACDRCNKLKAEGTVESLMEKLEQLKEGA